MKIGVLSRRPARAALGAIAVLAISAVAVPVAPRAEAISNANITVGFVADSKVVINSWAYDRIGIYSVSIGNTPTRAVSIEANGISPAARNETPAGDSLSLKANTINSGTLDYLLWKYAGTTDPVQAAALHLVAWQLAPDAQVEVGGTTPDNQNWDITDNGPATPGWGLPGRKNPGLLFASGLVSPTNAATGQPYVFSPAIPDATALADAIEDQARAMLADAQSYQGPWTVTLVLDWGSFIGTVSVKDADNSPAPGITVALTSNDSVVPSSVTTDSSGVSSFIFDPNDDVATVTASLTAPGVHKEYDATGNFQRVAIAQQSNIQTTFAARQPTISTYAKDAVDGDKFVGAGGQIIDTVQYQHLVPNGTYTAELVWHYQDTTIASSLAATTTFQASPSGTGTVDVGPLTVGSLETGRALVAFETLYRGPDASGFPVATHADIDDASQTVTVLVPQLVSVAHDVYDDDHTAFVGGSIFDTVSYLNLAPGAPYIAEVHWRIVDGTDQGGDTALTTTQTFFADASGSGTVDVGPVTVTAEVAGKKLVAFERIYAGSTVQGDPIVTHLDPNDTQQQIDVPQPVLTTIARDAADGNKTVIALGQVTDQVSFTNLQPGATYTLQLEWRLTEGVNDNGPTGIFATTTFTPDAPAGVVIVGPVGLGATASGQTIVAYERLYVGPTVAGVAAARHEIPTSFSQQLEVLPQTITTDATEGTPAGTAIPGDREITIGSGATLVDTITLTGVAVGTQVTLEGALVRWTDGVCSVPVSTTTATVTVGPGGVVKLVHAVPEAPGDYVAYVIVKSLAGAELSQHQDCSATGQRVAVSFGDDTPLPETR